LKKLFPENPLDHSYHATLNETTSILPLHTSTSSSDKYATPSEFRQALDKEKDKVDVFYRSKFDELLKQLDLLGEEIAALESRDLGQDDTIKEEDEEEEDDEDEEDDDVVKPVRPAVASPMLQTGNKPKRSMFSRLAPSFRGKRRGISSHEADLLEAPLVGSRNRSRSASRGVGSVGLESSQEEGYFSNMKVPRSTKGSRRTSDLESSEEGTAGQSRDRRTSLSSASSHDREYETLSRRRFRSLGLVQMDPASVPNAVREAEDRGEDEEQAGKMGPVCVWTAEDDYGKVLRIGFKKRISATWLEAYALKQYVDLNMTAFEKILKK
jgi:phosphate transporter